MAVILKLFSYRYCRYSYISQGFRIKINKHRCIVSIQWCLFGAGDRTWTGTVLPPRDFKGMNSPRIFKLFQWTLRSQQTVWNIDRTRLQSLLIIQKMAPKSLVTNIVALRKNSGNRRANGGHLEGKIWISCWQTKKWSWFIWQKDSIMKFNFQPIPT